MSTRDAVSAIAGAILREAVLVERRDPMLAESLRRIVDDLNAQLEQW